MISNKSFAITLPYNRQLVTAYAVENDFDLVTEYEITFPDGHKSTFSYYHDCDEKDAGWFEQGLEITQLSKDVGVTLDEYMRLLNKKPQKALKDDLNF